MSDENTLEDHLQASLTASAADLAAVSADDLATLWAQMFPGQDGATRTGLRTFQTAFRAAVAGTDGEEALNLPSGGWVIDLRGGLVRSALATAPANALLRREVSPASITRRGPTAVWA